MNKGNILEILIGIVTGVLSSYIVMLFQKKDDI